MTEYLEHRTLPGDRWDLLAYRYYGDAHLLGPIIEANPHLPISPKLAVGALVLIPVLAQAAVLELTPDQVPPWKR